MTGTNSLNSITMLSSATVDVGLMFDVAFYLNLALCFSGLVALTTLVVFLRKTLCARRICIAAIVVFAAGLLAFVVQLVMYTSGNAAAKYIVFTCFGILYAAFVVYGVYCGMLAKNSNRVLCIVTAVLCLIPPAGATFGILLSYKIQRDTRIKKLVFSGFAYTYAALCAFSDENGAEFIDSAADEEYEKLTARQARKKLGKLKKNIKSSEGMFEYAAAVVNYMPYKFDKALKLMKKSAEQGYAPAMFNLGYYYETGRGVKRDYKKAREYYEHAAANGDADAELRSILLDIRTENSESGFAALERRAADGDICAKYDLGVCYETGSGCVCDIDKAFDIYTECANSDMYIAQRRILAAASNDMSSASNGGLFRKITDRTFTSEEFSVMIAGLIDVKKRLAADASDKFLQAIKYRGKWEGVARCLVGTLYIDRGKLKEDRKNGAEYVRSALEIWDGAAEVYAVIPK